MRKYRLTTLFIFTAVVSIALAASIVNLVVGRLAENNLTRIAEEQSAREAVHLEAMLSGQQSMEGTTTSATGGGHAVRDAVGALPHIVSSEALSGDTLPAVESLQPLTVETLKAVDRLLSMVPTMAAGLNVVKVSLLDLNGTTLWSTDPSTIGKADYSSDLIRKASEQGIGSEFIRDVQLVDFGNASRRADVVETYLPLRDSASAQITGFVDIYRDVSADVAIQVDQARAVVLWTTVGTMGGLLLALLGFILAADVTIQRSRRRQLAVVEEANRALEERVHHRTSELQMANDRLVETQDQLVRHEKLSAIGQLAGGVAHDLRNPLGAIHNAVYYLKRKLGSSDVARADPRISQFLQIVDDEVAHSNQIISDLLSFSRVKAPSMSPTDIGELVQSSVTGVELGENVSLVESFEPDLPQVPADGEQLHRVFVNLAMNAWDAMPEGGELSVTTRSKDGFAEVSFSDTGTGISEQDMKRIFDPLFTTKTKGTGLGLAICNEVVSKHGGSISVESDPGARTTFTIKLPLNGASEPHQER